MDGSISNIDYTKIKCLIVGCGLFGSCIAQKIAEQDKKLSVHIIDKFSHPGGTAYSYPDPETGIELHKYGSHIFHTSDEKVWKYINRFTDFFPYRHKVLLKNRSKTYFLPVNLKTINEIGGCSLTPAEAEKLFSGTCDNEISQLQKKVCNKLFAGYTAKQWGTPLTKISAEIIKRLPVRFDYNIDYFDDIYQGIPENGYGFMIANLLSAPNIKVILNTDFFKIRHLLPKDCRIIYSGRIDSLFGYKFGKLQYRSLDFDFSTLPVKDFQGNSVINYADKNIPYTRIHEFKHFLPRHISFNTQKTVICKEIPAKFTEEKIPFYPVNDNENTIRYSKYCELAEKEKFLLTGGRIGSFSYLNMDQTILQALEKFDLLDL